MTWRELLQEEFEYNEDGGYRGNAKILESNLFSESFDKEFNLDASLHFDAKPFYLYTKEYIYFSGVDEDNNVTVFSMPRNPPEQTDFGYQKVFKLVQ